MCFYLSGTTHIIFKWRRLLFNFWDALHHSVHYPSMFYKWIHEFFPKKRFLLSNEKFLLYDTFSLLYLRFQDAKNFVVCYELLYVTKSNTAPRVFFTFLKFYGWYQIVQSVSYVFCVEIMVSLDQGLQYPVKNFL